VTRLLASVVVVVGVVLLFPALGSVPGRLSRACAGWLTIAGGFELLSAAGYVALFALAFCRGMTWRSSSRIACGSLAAAAVLPAGGVAGPALGAVCARAKGTPTPSVASRVTGFILLTNAPNLVVLVALGLGLWTGLVPGPHSAALTLVPAAGALGLLAVIGGVGARARSRREPTPPEGWPGAIARLPATLAMGVHEALTMLRTRNWRLIGAVASYGFDNMALWAAFRAFGHSPAASVLIMAFLMGGLGNALPLPAGVGGTELGLFGSLVLYGTGAGPAAVAVLGYRVVSTGVPLALGAFAIHLPHPSMTGSAESKGSRAAPTADHGARRRAPASSRTRVARPRGRTVGSR